MSLTSPKPSVRYHRHLFVAASDALNLIFFENRYADKVIESFFRKNRKWGKRDRQFFAETVYDSVRWWRLYWYFLNKEKNSKETFLVLAASLFAREKEKPDFEEYQSLDFRIFQKRWDELNDPAIAHAFPQWLYDHCKNQQPEIWDDIVHGLNQVNAIILRTNTLLIQRGDLVKKLKKEGLSVEALPHSKTGVLVSQRANVFQTEAFKKGLFEVQDGSSQMVGEFLDLRPGQMVIDACAGAGGKSLHIGAKLENKGRVLALDIHQWKLDQLKLRARRNKVFNIEGRLIQTSKTIKRLEGKADRLLLDVPCTGLGVLRRNPDTKWKLSLQRIDELRDLQAQLLQDYSRMLKSGGIMVYSTCSILPQENQDQVQMFLQKNPTWRLEKQKHIYPIETGFDGFYMAQLQKA